MTSILLWRNCWVRHDIYKNADEIERTEVLNREINIYDKKGKTVENYRYSYIAMPHTGTIDKPIKEIYFYDKNGGIVETKRYFSSGEPGPNVVILIQI